jgi:hypothetical protein
MKRIIALLLVLVLVCSFASCALDKKGKTTGSVIGCGPDKFYRYYTEDIGTFIDTWKSEYMEEDNMFLDDMNVYSDMLLVPRIKDYTIIQASLSNDISYCSFNLGHNSDLDDFVLWFFVICSRKEEPLVDYLLRRKIIKKESELTSDLFYDNNIHRYYLNAYGVNICVDVPRSYEFETAEELLEFLNFEVMYPYDEASEATSTT